MNIKKAVIHLNIHGERVTVTPPDGKEMVFDPAQLQHGVLSLGEYGPSGQKVAAFNDWSYAVFVADDSGYTIVRDAENPF